MKARYRRACDALVEQLHPLLIDEGYRENSCILATRLAVDALQQQGAKAQALVTQMVAFSPELVAHLDAGGQFDESAPGWSVGIGVGEDDTPGYFGHLLTVVNNELALDLTLAQAARPKHDLRLAACAFEVDKNFLSGAESAYIEIDGSVVTYSAQPQRKDYATSPDWSETLKRAPQLVRDVREIAARASASR